MTLTQITEKGIKDGEIINADINASASIAQSKLNTFVNTNGVHRIITGSATKNTLSGNSNLTYNGVTLKNQLAAENGTIAQFELSGNTNDPALLIKADESDSKITFRAGATTNVYPKIAFDMGTVGDAVTILNDGKVGVGTTSPAQLFHVNGQAKVGTLGIGQDAGSSTLAITGNMAINTTGNTAYSKFNIAGSGNTTGSAFTINNYGDVEGDYYHFGVNATQNASGNNSKTNTAKRSAAVRLDGRLGNIVFQTSQTSTSTIDEHFTFDRGGDFTLAGNVKVASGKGIDFSANTGAAGMSSELFDHYEEGTFTPGVTSGLAAGAISYNSRSGKYTRVGNVVYFTFHININSASLDSGALKFGNLPFTSANTSHTAGGMWKIFTNGNIDANATYKVIGNSTDIQVVTGAGDNMAANATSIDAGHRHMAYWGFYYV